MCLETRRPSLQLHNYCCVVSKWMEMFSRGKAALVQTDLWRDFQLKFHGVFSCCFRFDRSGLGWIAAAGSSSSLDTGRSLKCFEGSSLGSPEGPWPPWVMLSARSLSLTDVNGGDHAGGSQAHRWGKPREQTGHLQEDLSPLPQNKSNLLPGLYHSLSVSLTSSDTLALSLCERACVCSRARVRSDVKSNEDDNPSEAIIVHRI